MTAVSVIKWSQNCTKTIRSDVVGIPKYIKNARKAGYFKKLYYAKNTTSDGPSSILRPLCCRYFCQITIEKWSQICTRTITKGFFKDILFLGLFPIVIPIVNLIANLDHEGVELSCWIFLWLISAPKDTIKKLSVDMFGCFWQKFTRPNRAIDNRQYGNVIRAYHDINRIADMFPEYLNTTAEWVKVIKILLSLAPNWCKPYLHKFFLQIFLADIFLVDANKRIGFCFNKFPTFT